jgi:hypothetical protein
LDGTSIEEVQANDNQLTMIPSVGNAFFKKINVANNKITEMRIPSEGGCFIFCYYTLAPNIEWIDISNNLLQTFNATSSGATKIKYLDLRGNTNIKSLSDLYTSSGTVVTQSEAMMTAKDETVTIKSLGDGSPLQITVLPSYANECGITESDLQEIKTIPAFQWYKDYSANKWCSMDKLSLVNRGIPYLPEWF